MTVDLKEAPPDYLEALIAKTKAEANAAKADARTKVAEAKKRELELRKLEREEKRTLTANEHYNTYFFGHAVSEKSVEACIQRTNQWARTNPGCDIEVVFSSPGGSIIDGFVLFDHLRALSAAGHNITTGTLGMAASMAGVLLQAGDHRWMGREAWVLIHRAAFGQAGKTFEVEDRVEWIKRIEARIIDIYVSRTSLTSNRIKRNWERKDWWLSSDECDEHGIVDEVRG